jgi:hypothetical protein
MNIISSELENAIGRFGVGWVGEVVKTQTTYLDFVCYQAELSEHSAAYRIRFQGKNEFFLAKGRFTSLILSDKHPLLVEYTEPFMDIYLASLIGERQKFIADLEFTATQIFDGWRSLDRYLNPQISLDELLTKGFGLLMSAPFSFAKLVMGVAEKNGVVLNLLQGHKPSKQNARVLLLDTWYVVADSFSAEFLGSYPPNKSLHDNS